MLHDWGVIAAAFGYIGFLFVVASYGERLINLLGQAPREVFKLVDQHGIADSCRVRHRHRYTTAPILAAQGAGDRGKRWSQCRG